MYSNGKKSKTSHIFIWISRSSCKHTANTFFSSFRSNADTIAFVSTTDNWWLDSLGTCLHHINGRKNASFVGAECSFCCYVEIYTANVFRSHFSIMIWCNPHWSNFRTFGNGWLQLTSANVSHMRGKHTACHWNTFRGRCEIIPNFSIANFGVLLNLWKQGITELGFFFWSHPIHVNVCEVRMRLKLLRSSQSVCNNNLPQAMIVIHEHENSTIKRDIVYLVCAYQNKNDNILTLVCDKTNCSQSLIDYVVYILTVNKYRLHPTPT